VEISIDAKASEAQEVIMPAGAAFAACSREMCAIAHASPADTRLTRRSSVFESLLATPEGLSACSRCACSVSADPRGLRQTSSPR
jgi:hypothetical protein